MKGKAVVIGMALLLASSALADTPDTMRCFATKEDGKLREVDLEEVLGPWTISSVRLRSGVAKIKFQEEAAPNLVELSTADLLCVVENH